MEAIRNSSVKLCLEGYLECLGVPQRELRLVGLPVMNGRHQVAIIFILERIGSISLLVVNFASGVSLSKRHLPNNFVRLLIEFDETGEAFILLFRFGLWNMVVSKKAAREVQIPALVPVVVRIQDRKL